MMDINEAFKTMYQQFGDCTVKIKTNAQGKHMVTIYAEAVSMSGPMTIE